jgi:type IV secretory pathway VirB9-like protein
MQLKRCAIVLTCGSLLAGQSGAVKPPLRSGAAKEAGRSKALPAGAEEPPAATKVVRYGERDVVPIKAKLRYTTLLVLPKSEQILDFTCGDKEFWVINGAQNLAYVKPAKSGAHTNLNLITASGNIYSFLLSEVSDEPQEEPDLKVFVEPKEESMLSAASAAPRLFSAQQVDDYKQQAELAKEETRRLQASAQATIDKGITSFVESVRFPYRFEAGKKPFYVRAIYTDDRFTYIRARPEETPALYEIKDGKPNLVQFEYKNGAYIVGKVLESGYLAIGKQKLSFSKQE